MEQQQARVLVGLSAVLSMAVALLYLWEEAVEDPDPDAIREVWEVDPDSLVRVEVERAEDRLILVRVADQWRLEAPMVSNTDPDQVDSLLSALGEVRRGIPLDVEPSARADFGLGATPVARVRVFTDEGDQHTLVVGKASPVGFRTYVLDGEQVVAVNGRPGEALNAPASDYRDRRVFTFHPEQVRHVRIEGPDGVLHVHGEGRRWWVDGWTRADPDKVDDLVVGLLDLRFDAFASVDRNPIRAVSVEDADGSVQRLYVGTPTSSGVAVWTEAGEEGVAFPGSLALLGQGPTDVGDRRAFPIDLDRVESIAVTRGQDRWEALRNGNTWRVRGVEDPNAAMVVEALGAATITYRRAPVTPITIPWVTVEISEDKAIYLVDVGQIVDGSARVARDRSGGAPYLVPLTETRVLETLFGSDEPAP